MARFNASVEGTNKTVNRDGGPAYKITDVKEKLVREVLASLWSPKYYGDTNGAIIQDTKTLLGKGEVDFICRLAVFARKEYNLRTVSHVLAGEVCLLGGPRVRHLIQSVVLRPDDLLEIWSYVLQYRKDGHIPNALKRATADVLNRMQPWEVAKYKAAGKAVNWRDLLRITHPEPHDNLRRVLFKQIIDDDLPTIVTWETELSAKGNSKETWQALIDADKVPYMACLRNLRNMVNAGADMTKVIAKLTDPEQVAKSRQFPYRFYSAARQIPPSAYDVRDAISTAFDLSIANVPKLSGRTMIGVDVSGSMDCPISPNSKITAKDIAELFGAMSGRICEDADVCYFSSCGWYSSAGYKLEHYGPYSDILQIADENHRVGGGGTDLSLVLQAASKQLGKPYDRIIIFTDDMVNYGWPSCQGMLDKYKAEKNPNVWCHVVDLAGYGTQSFIGDKVNYIAGWDDSCWSFMQQAEAGFDRLVQTIQGYVY